MAMKVYVFPSDGFGCGWSGNVTRYDHLSYPTGSWQSSYRHRYGRRATYPRVPLAPDDEWVRAGSTWKYVHLLASTYSGSGSRGGSRSYQWRSSRQSKLQSTNQHQEPEWGQSGSRSTTPRNQLQAQRRLLAQAPKLLGGLYSRKWKDKVSGKLQRRKRGSQSLQPGGTRGLGNVCKIKRRLKGSMSLVGDAK